MLTLPPKAKLEIVPPPATDAAPSGSIGDVTFASASDIASRVRRRELSPFEVARAIVERADTHRSLRAFITLRPEAVLREARQLETRLQSGEDLGPLAGVPGGGEGPHAREGLSVHVRYQSACPATSRKQTRKSWRSCAQRAH